MPNHKNLPYTTTYSSRSTRLSTSCTAATGCPACPAEPSDYVSPILLDRHYSTGTTEPQRDHYPCPSIRPPIHPFIHVSIHPSMHPSIHPPIHTHVRMHMLRRSRSHITDNKLQDVLPQVRLLTVAYYLVHLVPYHHHIPRHLIPV